MIEDNPDLAQYRLQKANDHLKSAEILLNAGMYNDSLGRSYYAMFNAARAFLALKELDSKKHSGVISSGIIDRMAGRDLNKARVRRESSDYADFYLVSKEDSFNQLEMAKRFIKTIKSALE